jgi:uncharacterized protein YjbI with pentapeptide repeats
VNEPDPFIPNSSVATSVLGMAEDKGTRTSEREKDGTQPPPPKPWTLKEFGGKPVWDWMDLLIVPIVLALITVAFTVLQDARQQRIEDQRAEAERELAQQRAQDAALQAYLDQMSHLLLEKDLRGSKEGSVVGTLARARTFATMQRLDAQRNQTIARFLGESELIATDGTTTSLLKGARLDHADLAGVDLRRADLSEANLQGANLHMASLKYANLRDADLSGTTDLNNATLEGATLEGADLTNAKLKFTDFRSVYPDITSLTNANLSRAFLFGARLEGTWMPRADLRNAALIDADLDFANLRNADLSGANLKNADLRCATLTNANLRNAKRVSEVQLRKVWFLKGTTMPNGQKCEDLLKGIMGRGEDAENPDPS